MEIMINLLFSILLYPFYLCGLFAASLFSNTSSKNWLYYGMMYYPENPYINAIYSIKGEEINE